ncbi:MAG: M20/M25/M40 family metallo-hydrolase [Chloroflexota bacterium]
MSTALEWVDAGGVIAFAKKIIRIPSPSRQEARVAHVVAAEMQRLGYDEVSVDEMYNVKGTFRGSGSGPTLLFNGHIDHAEVGTMPNPHEATEMDGERFGVKGKVIYGRAACDMKAGVAAMIYGTAAAQRARAGKLRGTAIVTADVREEEGRGEGIEYMLARGLRADMAVSGEATNLNVYIGHRGRTEWRVRFHGRTAHASNPERGVNAILKLNYFLNTLQAHYPLPVDPFLGRATYAPMDVTVSPGHLTPILPDVCDLFLDRRFVTGETVETIAAGLRAMIDLCKQSDPTFAAELENTKFFPLLYCEPEQPVVVALRKARKAVMGGESALGAWKFGVNGSFIQRAGIPCAGFGPGDEHFAHTPDDNVAVADVVTAAKVYAQLVADVCG